MPASLFVDSGVWLAFFSARDGRHRDADRLIREALRRKLPLFTTNLVLAEVHRLLLHRAGIRPAAAALNVIDQSPGVTVQLALAAAGVATYLLRVKFEFGLMELLKFLLAPKHLSALAADRHSSPYPARRGDA